MRPFDANFDCVAAPAAASIPDSSQHCKSGQAQDRHAGEPGMLTAVDEKELIGYVQSSSRSSFGNIDIELRSDCLKHSVVSFHACLCMCVRW